MYQIIYSPLTLTYEFRILDTNISYKGTLEQVTTFAMSKGIEEEELTLAYNEMTENIDTVAEFGIAGKFLYSHSTAYKIINN